MRSAGQQLERLAVTWPHRPEVAMVKGRELGLVEPLRHRQHAGVDEASTLRKEPAKPPRK